MNDRFFNNINSYNVAYWIGFIAADGSINITKGKLNFGLSIKDKEHLEEFKNTIKCTNVITERDTLCTNGKYYPSCYLTINSKKIVSDLLTYGIEEQKSYKNIDFLSYVPDEYKFSFICGLFDGDGWFCNTEKTKNFGICGNEKNITSVVLFLKKYFHWEYLKSHKDNRSETTFYFQTGAKNKLLEFINSYLALENECDLLKRKVDIAKSIKNNIVSLSEEKDKNKIEKECPICSKKFYVFNHAKQKYCSQKCAHIAQQRIIRPNREELKLLIRTTAFTTIGKQYGVSDNAIRKWCDSYNLPRKVSEIKKYSDKEWKNI